MKYRKMIGLLALVFMVLCMFAPSNVFATAETLVGTRGVAGFPVYGKGQAGNLKTAYGVYNVTANVEDGDIFQLCRIPAGATVVGGTFYASDLDTGTEALDMDVGWAANGTDAASAAGLLNAGVLTGDAVTGYKPETGTLMPFGGVIMAFGKYTFSEETIIQVEANVAANSFSAGYIGVVIKYLME